MIVDIALYMLQKWEDWNREAWAADPRPLDVFPSPLDHSLIASLKRLRINCLFPLQPEE